MRDRTSQTTPSFFLRRIPLRMLSFVGVFSVALFCMEYAARHSATKTQQSADRSPKALPSQPGGQSQNPTSDEQTLASANENDGPRGQWGDQTDATESMSEGLVQQWDLFKSRAQERLEKLQLFRQRDHHQGERSEPAEEHRHDASQEEFTDPISVSLEEHAATEERALEKEETNQPIGDWDEPPASPPINKRLPPTKSAPAAEPEEDSTSTLSDLIFRNRKDDQEKKSLLHDETDREAETFEQPVRPRREQPPVSEPLREPVPSRNETVPSRKTDRNPLPPSAPKSNKRSLDDIATTKPDPSFDLRDEVPPKSSPLRENPEKTRRTDPLGVLDEFTTLTPRSNPVAPPREPSYAEDPDLDTRRGRDLFIEEPPANSGGSSNHPKVASVEIEKRYLDQVQDNTMGIRKDEAESFYWLLDHSRRVPSRKMEKAGLTDVQYINLMTEPNRFRGEPVTIEGDLWRLYEFDASENTYDVNRVYEGWVFTGESANHPYRIVCTSLPKGIEPGENMRIPVRLTGYFYKLEGYRSSAGVHVAPTLLAKRMKVNPLPNAIPMMSGFLPYLLGTIMAVGIALLVTTVGFAIGDERMMRSLLEQRRQYSAASFANVTAPALAPVELALKQFAERERQTGVSGAYGPLVSRQTARENGLTDYSRSGFSKADNRVREQKQKQVAVHDWVAKQKSSVAETQSALGTQTLLGNGHQHHSQRDELDSTAFEVARNRVTPAPQYVSNPPPLAQTPATTGTARPSALAEWEAEANRLTHQSDNRTSALHASAAEQIERDHQARERAEVERLERERHWLEKQERERRERERLSFPDADRDSTQFSLGTSHTSRSSDHADQERLRRELVERERLERLRIERELQERERLERERIEKERAERDRIERERRTGLTHKDRHSSDVTEYGDEFEDLSQSSQQPASGESHLKKRRGGGWGWPRRRKNESDVESTDTNDQTASDDQSSNGGTSFGWGRSRKKRRNWSDDESA